MEKTVEPGTANAAHRRLSQIKVLTRLVEHELNTAKSKEVSLDRHLVESILDTLEIYVEDFEASNGATKRAADAKPQVTRLN